MTDARSRPGAGGTQSAVVCPVLRVLAVLCSLGWFANALLHVLLLVGMPCGSLVLGGTHEVLPVSVRPVSLALAVVWSLCGWAWLAWAGVTSSRFSHRWLGQVVRGTTVFLVLASVFNLFVSTSPAERYVTGTMTVVMLALSLLAVLGATPAASRLAAQHGCATTGC